MSIIWTLTGRGWAACLVRDDRDVWVRLVELPVTEIWSSRQTVDTVARAFLRAFDDVAREYGHSRYQDKWGQPFPSTALERLRTTWRQYKAAEDR